MASSKFKLTIGPALAIVTPALFASPAIAAVDQSHPLTVGSVEADELVDGLTRLSPSERSVLGATRVEAASRLFLRASDVQTVNGGVNAQDTTTQGVTKGAPTGLGVTKNGITKGSSNSVQGVTKIGLTKTVSNSVQGITKQGITKGALGITKQGVTKGAPDASQGVTKQAVTKGTP